MMRILLVEDDVMIGAALKTLLKKEHHAIDWTRDGLEADTALRTEQYDLVILDLGLPRRDGIDVLKAIRARKCATPVLIATARDALSERVSGLDAGADDYIGKPFHFEELLARVRALLRRPALQAESVYSYGDVVINLSAHEARVRDQTIDLSASEWAVLTLLIRRPGVILSREQLEATLYGWSYAVSSNAIEVYVHGIRKKLHASLIETVRGLGYRVPRP